MSKKFRAYFMTNPKARAIDGIRNLQEWREVFPTSMIPFDQSADFVQGALILQAVGGQNLLVIDSVKVCHGEKFEFVNNRCNSFHFLFNERDKENRSLLCENHWLWRTTAIGDIQNDLEYQFISALDKVQVEEGKYALDQFLFAAHQRLTIPPTLRADQEGASYLRLRCRQEGFLMSIDQCLNALVDATKMLDFKVNLRRRTPSPIRLYTDEAFLECSMEVKDGNLEMSDDLCKVKLRGLSEGLTKKLVDSLEQL